MELKQVVKFEAERDLDFANWTSGIVLRANLIVATQNNAVRMAMSVEKAAKGLIHGGHVPGEVLNKIEMAFRAYDPCNACATHALPGEMPLLLTVRDRNGKPISEVTRAIPPSVLP